MADTIQINVVDKSLPPMSNKRIAIIGVSNPAMNVYVNKEQLLQLIQFPQYWITDSISGDIISGANIEDYFPSGGGGGGGVTPDQVQRMINSSLRPVDERIDKVESDIEDIDSSTVTEYTKNTEIPAGKIVYAIAGQLYQATRDFTSQSDPSLTPEEALQADVTAGNLTPVTDSDVATLETRVTDIEEWKPTVDQDIADLKVAVAAAEEMEFYTSIDDFPEEGEDDITYIDKSTGKTYTWNSETGEYDLMNANNILDGSIFNSIL